VITHSNNSIAAVGYLRINKFRLESKEGALSGEELRKSLSHLVKTRDDYLQDHPSFGLGDFELSTPSLKQEKAGHQISLSGGAVARTVGSYVTVSTVTAIQGATPAEQMGQVIATLIETLHTRGATIEDVVQVTLYLRDMKEFANVNGVYSKGFPLVNPPTRVCVEVPLPEGVHLQLDCVAFVPENRNTGTKADKQVLHVQGYSNWAPANIGPYSQVARAGDFFFLAGQIGFVPGQMVLAAGTSPKEIFLNEFNFTLRNVEEVASVAGASLTSTVCAICYVSRAELLAPAKTLWQKYWAQQQQHPPSPPVLYICLPHLPRGGAVEWQLMVNNSQDLASTSCASSALGGGVSVDTTAHFTGRVFSSLSIFKFEGNDANDVSQVVKLQVEELRKSLAKGEFYWHHVLFMRVFSSPTLSADHATNYLSSLATALETQMILQLVPTDEILGGSLAILVFAAKE